MAAEPRRIVALAVALLGLAAQAGPIAPLAKGDVGAALAAESGLLLLAVESPVSLSKLRFSRLEGSKYKGSYEVKVEPTTKFNARLVPLAPGRYQLERVELDGGYVWKHPKERKKLSFEVRSGSVTYLGHLALVYGDLGLRVEAKDRSGHARVWVEEHHGGLLTRFPIRYAGEDDDGWTETLVP